MTYYPGRFKRVCDICSFEFYNTETYRTWDNLWVCKDCLDNGGKRDPQDYAVRPKADRQLVRNARPEKSDKPTVLEVEVTSITSTTAASGGNVTHDGGSTVTAYGCCWSTSPAPTTSDSSTSDGTGTGAFTSAVTGLSAGTRYFLRAYATNAVGTAYGPTREFTTPS